MIRLLSLLLVISFSTFNLQAQDTRYQVGVGTGAITTTDLVSGLIDIASQELINSFSSIWGPNPDVNFRNYSFNPTLALGGEYLFHKRWSLIADYAYNSLSRDIYTEADYRGFASSTHHSLGIGIKGKYYKTDWVEMYSTFQMGVTFENVRYQVDDESARYSWSYFNLHTTLYGLRVGQQLGGSFELGLGYQGIVRVGVDYRF
ncbi:MAG: hypothetical protein HWD92_13420 [Flavobacteriia bacterium]|nr:hypothetical protein [Flavobacteriia bacterium]